MEKSRAIAAEQSLDLISLDEEIERTDGRSVKRICMMMGEHEYRNKEYEALKAIVTQSESASSEAINSTDGFVVCCGDGVLHDDMSRKLIEGYELMVVGGEESPEALWEKAKDIDDSYHAFMYFGTEEKRYKAFIDLYERQRALFTPYIK